MKLKPILKTSVIILFSLVVFPLFSQSKFAVGFQVGRSSLVPETIEIPNQLPSFEAMGAGGVNMIIYGRYYFHPNWSIRMGGGIIGYKSAYFNNSISMTNSGFGGVKPQVMTGIDYHLCFRKSNIGVILSAGLNANRAHRYDNSTIVSEEGFPLIIFIAWPDDLSLYGHEVEYNYSTQKTLLHFRPEVTLFKQLGRHKLLASLVYGHALKEPISTTDYRSISYSGEYYAARHRFSGSFTALQLGYEFRF